MRVATESLEQQEPQAVPSNESNEPTTELIDAATTSQDRMVPVTEAIRYRKRAQSAEQALSALRQQLEESTRRYEEAEQTISSLERRQRIDELLSEADAIDMDAARLLTEAVIRDMPEADVAEAVADLRRHKPYLFDAGREEPGGLALAPRIEGIDDPLAQAAEQAQHSGDRRDLLRYLRLRRRP